MNAGAESNEAVKEEVLNAELEKTEASFNVIRNKTGSVTVPEAIDDRDAVNKKFLVD